MMDHPHEYIWVRVSIRRTLQMASSIPLHGARNEFELEDSEFPQLPTRFIDHLRAVQMISQTQLSGYYSIPNA
jgi:hypothetical protein